MAKKRRIRKKTLLGRKKRSFLDKKKYVEGQAKRMVGKMTWPEREFAKLMKEVDLECEAQRILGTKIFDFYLPSKNMLIEVHGDYYHANPIIYENKKTNKMQNRNVKNDSFKKVLAKGMGYGFEVVWEYDLKNNYYLLKEQFEKLKNEES